MIKKTVLFFFAISIHSLSVAHNNPVGNFAPEFTLTNRDSTILDYRKLILPVSLMTVGSISFAIPSMKEMDRSTKIELSHHNLWRTSLDDYTQYFPAAMVYGFNLAGIKGKHAFKDRTIIYVSSQLISAAIVTPAKYLISEERPDGSNRKSFPSGHAATAFSSAHFMYKEYRDNNLILSLSGYPFAMFTGVYRLINDKHWVTDVIAGAGVGILSTELAYWLYPKTKSLFKTKSKTTSHLLMPYYQQEKVGFTYVVRL